MEINLNKLSDEKIRATGGKNIKMGLSEGATGIIFNMFTETIYKNAIGSVVREITSNCFDSHIEAKNETPENPVIIKKTFDKIANTHYISFFDNGVGMSPERIEKVYGRYFESTKRATNDEIGGFGIGGKTPLAYKRKVAVETTDEDGNVKTVMKEDSSFFVITRYNGIEYSYSIYKGETSPEIQLLHECSTKKGNGTEIRIPVNENDLSRFEHEIKRQLYYFENIVYQGFSIDEELNNYNVYKGTNFLYRGGDYEDSVHICLGKVAYKLSYNELGLSEWDYRIPIALKFNIGDIGVTANREELQYNEDSVKTILEKMELAKEEIRAIASKQYSNVRTLEDYYEAIENFGNITFEDQKSLNVSKWVNKNTIDFKNFKYNDLPFIPKTDNVIDKFYNVHEYGKTSGYYGGINVQLGVQNDRVYFCKGEFKRKVLKQSFLNYEHDKNFVILKPYGNEVFTDDEGFKRLRLAFGVTKDKNANNWGQPKDLVDVIDITKATKLLKDFAKDVAKIVAKTFTDYDNLEVPQDFIDARKQERLSKEILNTTIPVRDQGYRSPRRIKIKNIIDYKGKVYWGTTDDNELLHDAANLYTRMFGDNHLDSVSYRNSFTIGRGVAFIGVSKTNAKYMKMAPNAIHVKYVYPTLLHRKMVKPANVLLANEFLNKIEAIDDLYQNETFGTINKKCADYYQDIMKEKESLSMYKDYQYVNLDHILIKSYIDLSDKKPDFMIMTDKKLEYLLNVQKNNREVLEFVNFPNYNVSYTDFTKERYSVLVDMLKKVMVF